MAILVVALWAAGSTDISGELTNVFAAYSVVVATALAAAIVICARRVFERQKVTVDTILGALVVYLFL